MARTSTATKPAGDVNTRQKLLDAASKVFSSKTFLNATVDDIVHEAGCARGTFYLYFKDKKDVFQHVVAHLTEQTIRAISAGDNSEGTLFDRIKSSNRAFLTFFGEHAGIYRDMHVVASFDPAVEEFVVNEEKPFAARFRRRLEKSMRHAEQDDIDLDVASWVLTLMIEYFGYVWLAAKRLPDGDKYDMERVVSTISSLMYRAIFLEPSHASGRLKADSEPDAAARTQK